MVLAGVMMAPSTCTNLTLVCKRSTPSSGVVVDRQGVTYPVTLARLGSEFEVLPPREGEILEGIVLGPGQVTDVTDLKTECFTFESVGVNPDGDAIAEELGRRLEGGRPQKFGNPDSGRFSHPKGLT